MDETKYMPVLPCDSYSPGCPKKIPMSLLDEGRAMQNHGQTLQRLKQRGGLSVKEILAIILNKPWSEISRIPATTAVAALKNILDQQISNMSDKPTTPEQEIIYRIVEQWGNAACPMNVMEQWLKEYANALHPSESAGVNQLKSAYLQGIEDHQLYHEELDEDAGFDEFMKKVTGSAGASAVWVKSQYDQLYEQVKTGKRTVCYIDYHAHGVDKVYRDICTIRPDVLEFSSRGVGYGCAQYMDGDEKTNFIQFCEKMNVEWLRESPSLAPDQAGKEDADKNL